MSLFLFCMNDYRLPLQSFTKATSSLEIPMTEPHIPLSFHAYLSKEMYTIISFIMYVFTLSLGIIILRSSGLYIPVIEGVSFGFQFTSVAQSCPTLCNPMDCSMWGFPVDHELPELTQTHAHWVGDAIQPPHPLLSPSPTFKLSQHQGLFKWVSSLHQVK